VNKSSRYVVAVVAAVAAVGAVAVVSVPILGRALSLSSNASVQAIIPTVLGGPDSPDDTATGSPGDAVSGSWQLGSGSTVGYRIGETGDDDEPAMEGSTSDIHGAISMSGGTLTTAEFTVDLSTLSSDDGARDAVLRSIAIADGNPNASFVLTQPVTVASTDSSEGLEQVPVAGDLTVHGVTNKVKADLDVIFSGDSGIVSGSIPVDLASFGIAVPDVGVAGLDGTAYIDVRLVISTDE
jgi:polyisoprenoid-binding protein YceI